MLIIWKSATDNQLISVPVLPGDNHRKIRDRLPLHGWHGEPYFVSSEDEAEKAIAQYKEHNIQNPEWELPDKPVPQGLPNLEYEVPPLTTFLSTPLGQNICRASPSFAEAVTLGYVVEIKSNHPIHVFLSTETPEEWINRAQREWWWADTTIVNTAHSCESREQARRMAIATIRQSIRPPKIRTLDGHEVIDED